MERVPYAVAMKISADGVRIEGMFKGLASNVPGKTSTAVPDIKEYPGSASCLHF